MVVIGPGMKSIIIALGLTYWVRNGPHRSWTGTQLKE